MKRVVFQPQQDDFASTLKQRIAAYFRENNISPYANAGLYLKTALMLALFIAPYFLLLLGGFGLAANAGLVTLMGIGMAGIGFAVSHQAAHNAISPDKTVNRIFSLSFNLTGMSDYIWKIKHNVYHHAYTNVYELDEALREGEAIRMSHDAPWKPIHRFQHIYTFVIYALFTIFWALLLDFEKYFRYNAHGARMKKAHPWQESVIFWLTKVYYVTVAFVIPHYGAGIGWAPLLTAFTGMHVIASLLVTHVLQVEHLNEQAQAVTPDEKGIVHKSWMRNQLEGTSNFRSRSRLFNWYISGTNYQIEHHLFPNICAVHYPAMSKIVAKTAREYGISYDLMPSFAAAIASHYKLLRELGRNKTSLAAGISNI